MATESRVTNYQLYWYNGKNEIPKDIQIHTYYMLMKF